MCAFDNRDTTYPAVSPRFVFPTDDDFYVVYGVNHVVTNKVSYANVSVYGLQHLYGIASASSNDYAPNSDRTLGSIAFRTYLEPGTNTAPDPTTLVRDRVKHFHH